MSDEDGRLPGNRLHHRKHRVDELLTALSAYNRWGVGYRGCHKLYRKLSTTQPYTQSLSQQSSQQHKYLHKQINAHPLTQPPNHLPTQPLTQPPTLLPTSQSPSHQLTQPPTCLTHLSLFGCACPRCRSRERVRERGQGRRGTVRRWHAPWGRGSRAGWAGQPSRVTPPSADGLVAMTDACAQRPRPTMTPLLLRWRHKLTRKVNRVINFIQKSAVILIWNNFKITCSRENLKEMTKITKCHLNFTARPLRSNE